MTNKLRVAHYPQIPCKPFTVEVKDESEAKKIVDVLTEQHLWLYDHKMIPDYCNAITVEMYDADIDEETGDPYGWVEYWNHEEMCEFDEFLNKL